MDSIILLVGIVVIVCVVVFFKIKAKKSIDRIAFNGFIGAKQKISSSKLYFSGGFRIDGTVRMDIEGSKGGDSLLIVGDSGRIEGNIKAKDAIIGGTVIGNVYTSGLIELSQHAKIEGSIEYSEIKKHDDAIVTGSSTKLN